jgi:hypothetical protein
MNRTSTARHGDRQCSIQKYAPEIDYLFPLPRRVARVEIVAVQARGVATGHGA